MKLELITKEFKKNKINCEPDNNCNPYYEIPDCEPGNTFSQFFVCRPEITGNVSVCLPIEDNRRFGRCFQDYKQADKKDSMKDNKNNNNNSSENNNDKK